jgi:hypothetical protein
MPIFQPVTKSQLLLSGCPHRNRTVPALRVEVLTRRFQHIFWMPRCFVTKVSVASAMAAGMSVAYRLVLILCLTSDVSHCSPETEPSCANSCKESAIFDCYSCRLEMAQRIVMTLASCAFQSISFLCAVIGMGQDIPQRVSPHSF